MLDLLFEGDPKDPQDIPDPNLALSLLGYWHIPIRLDERKNQNSWLICSGSIPPKSYSLGRFPSFLKQALASHPTRGPQPRHNRGELQPSTLRVKFRSPCLNTKNPASRRDFFAHQGRTSETLRCRRLRLERSKSTYMRLGLDQMHKHRTQVQPLRTESILNRKTSLRL